MGVKAQTDALREYQAAWREITGFEFKSYKLFGENLAALTSNLTNFYWDVPTIVGASPKKERFE